MAADISHKRIDIVLVLGLDDGSGKLQFKRTTLSNIRHDITGDEIVEISDAFRTLFANEIYRVEKVHYETVSA